MSSKTLVVVLVALAVIAQTCCCCTFLGGPQPPYAIAPSEETLQRLQERVDTIETDANGNFSLTISEEEMTALAAQALDEMDAPPPVSDPQVFFRNNRVELYMTIYLSDSFSLPGMLAFTIDAQEGDFGVTIEEMVVGPLPLPESITEVMTDTLNDALRGSMSDGESSVLITDVQTGDREMTVFGQMSR
jgi:uncharacterized protein YpmS